MANRPNSICQLQPGKLIDAQEGFVSTFNWVAKALSNLKGGKNCQVTWTEDDVPTIDVESGGGSVGGGVPPGEIEFEGTDGSRATGTEWEFRSSADSNVHVTVSNDGQLEFSVYYV